MSKPVKALPGRSFVGCCFHSFDDGEDEISKQGIIRAKVTDQCYLVQYFDWIMGEASTLELIELDEMKAWQFYETPEHMKFWYEYRYQGPKAGGAGVVQENKAEEINK